MKFDILNRFSGAIQVSVEIECFADAPPSIKLGLAVRAAIKEMADLRSADLRSADLRSADLSSANLSSANLRSANLRSADLSSADLSSANLRSANLRLADLRSANLRLADLRSANLSSANLSSADLRSADLSSANLSSANLRSADLSSANLSSANLRSAKDAELPIARTRILPEGQLIGWKKLKDGSIAKLSIPAEARRSHSFGRKCRAEFVDVLEGEGVSAHDGITRYKPGKRVPCDKWEEDWTQECAGGIHFFITKIEAENH